MFSPVNLTAFPLEREEKLKSIHRYSMFEVMYYRSNVWAHTQRVLLLVEELIPLAQKFLSFDSEKARAIALLHDDAEIVTGDFQAGIKSRMSEKELAVLQEQEEQAVAILSAKYPKKVGTYLYEELLFHAARKDCIEAKIVSYADKLDGYCESLHEVMAGNLTFITSVMFYTDIMSLFPIKEPILIDFFNSKDSSLTNWRERFSPMRVTAEIFKPFNKPHSRESILVDSNFPFYNLWRKMVIERRGEVGMSWLIDQKEFFP